MSPDNRRPAPTSSSGSSATQGPASRCEIATLRALGFSNFSVVVSVLAESAVLSLIGGVLGAVIAYAAFHGYQTATFNWQTFSQVAFAFDVTPALLVQGGLCALVMGFLGGLFPALRAARLPIAAALRQL